MILNAFIVQRELSLRSMRQCNNNSLDICHSGPPTKYGLSLKNIGLTCIANFTSIINEPNIDWEKLNCGVEHLHLNENLGYTID